MKNVPKILAKYKRLGKGQNPEELRVTVGEFNDIKYLDFRIWEAVRPNVWLPTTRGVTVRERECDDLADVIAKGGTLLVVENAARRNPVVPAAVVTPKPLPEPAEVRPAVVETSRSVPPWEPIPA